MKIKSFNPYASIYEKNKDLAEIGQKSPMRFAFLSSPRKGNKQCTPWVKCRDFLHDAFRAYVTKSSCKIWGFSYKYGEDPDIDPLRVRMVVKANNKETIFRGINLINHYEQRAGVENHHTSAYKLDESLAAGENIWVITGPKFWQRSPALLSMFTLLLRLGEKKEIVFMSHEGLEKVFEKISDPNSDDNDLKYLSKVWKTMDIVIKNSEELLFCGNLYEECITQSPQIPTSTYHNNMGIVSLCNFSYGDASKTKTLKSLITAEEEFEGIKIQSDKNLGNTYTSNRLYMCLVLKTGEEFKKITSITNCRESFIYHIGSYFQKEKPSWIDLLNKKISEKDLSIFVAFPSKDILPKAKLNKQQEEIEKALQILNYYENLVGIKKSTLQKANVVSPTKDGEIKTYGWLLFPSEEWYASPVMLSSLLYIFRAAKSAITTIGTKKDINTAVIDKLWKDFAVVCRADRDANIKKEVKNIVKVLKNRSILFSNRGNYLFGLSINASSKIRNNQLGIQSLLQGNHYDKGLIKNYYKLEENA